jgi:hypothetical protein
MGQGRLAAGNSGRRRPIRLMQRCGALASLVTLGLWLVLVSQAGATSFTWTGEAPASTPNWSSGANWGGSGPSGGSTVGLSFPHLTEATCATSSPTEACYTSNNDLAGMTVESMQIDDGDEYFIEGQGVTLGGGGLSASPASGSSGSAGDILVLPMSLGAPQTWSIAGRSGGAIGENGVLLAGNVTGSANALTVDLSNGPGFYLAGDTEVGPLTIQGANTSGAGVSNGVAALFGSQLNSSDGNPVTLSHIFFFGAGSVGPLTGVGAEVYVAIGGEPPAGTLQAASATFDSASELDFEVDGPGTLAGSDYSRLTSSGNVDLGGASVSLHVNPPSAGKPCPSLAPGTQYTLVSTTGTLSGSFGNAPEGAEIPIKFAKSCTQVSQYLKIAYNRAGTAQTVTGTVIAGPSSTTTISVLPSSAMTNQGVTLTATVGASSGSPYGTVEFRDNGTTVPGCASRPMTLGVSSYTATCQTSFAAASSPERLSAAFTPEAGINLKPSTSSSYELTVVQDPTTTSLQISSTAPAAGASVTFTASASPRNMGASRPSGSVEFLDGGTPIGSCASQPLSSSAGASCHVSYPAAGVHSITARYLGDANFDGSSSSAQTVVVQAQASTETTTANTQTTAAGSSSVSLAGANVAVQGNGAATVKLKCEGDGPCGGKLVLQAKRAAKRKRSKRGSRTVTIGVSSFSISAGKTVNVTIRLNGTGRGLLQAGHGQLMASLRIEKSSGATETKTVRLIEKASHRRRKRGK